MIVYLITNLVNGKRYVGQTRESLSLRWQRHVWKAHEGSELAIHRAIRKYGSDSFSVQELSIASNAAHLNILEKHFICELKTNNPHKGYNMTSGGEGVPGRVKSKAERAKKSREMMGNKNLLGHRHSKETLEKMRGPRGHHQNGNENYKNSWTPERKKMIGAIHAGKKQSAEQVRKRVLARKKTLEALGRTH